MRSSDYCDACAYRIKGTAYSIGKDTHFCKECYLDRTFPDQRDVAGESDATWIGGEPDAEPRDRTKIASDGLSTDYYKLPAHATELRHVISHKDMSFSRGNLLKACYRLGEKDGTDVMYDLNKMEFFIQDLKEMFLRGERL